MVPLHHSRHGCANSAEESADHHEDCTLEEEEDPLFHVPKLSRQDTLFLLLHGNAKARYFLLLWLYLLLLCGVNSKYTVRHLKYVIDFTDHHTNKKRVLLIQSIIKLTEIFFFNLEICKVLLEKCPLCLQMQLFSLINFWKGTLNIYIVKNILTDCRTC
jgi:hypothetical protein